MRTVAVVGWPLVTGLVVLLAALLIVLSKPHYTTRLVRIIRAWRGK